MGGLIGNVFRGSNGSTSRTYNKATNTYTINPYVGSTAGHSGLVFALLMTAGQLVFRVMIWQARKKACQRFQIPGSFIGDGCATYFCSCCAIAQLATHVKSYTPGACNIMPPDVLPPFTN